MKPHWGVSRMKFTAAVLLGGGTLALAGCATGYDNQPNWAEGWRDGQVLRIAGTAEIPTSQFSDCRGKVEPTATWAVVSYRYMTRPRHRVVPLREQGALTAGDQVHVNVKSCDLPVIKR
jgi:hypothetical protein